MQKRVVALCVFVAGGVIYAQSSTDYAFEVATLKRNTSGGGISGIRRLPGGRVTATNMPARALILYAYQLGQWQLVGGAGWLADDRFDITAKIEGNPQWAGPGSGKPDPIEVAMRKLLVERFKLKIHTETRDLDAYALVTVKPGTPGPALKPSPTDCTALAEQLRQGKQPPGGPPIVDGIMPCSIMGGIGRIASDGFPMSRVATALVGRAGRPVIDRTNLTGNWRFLMTFAQEPPQNLPPGPEADKIAQAAANPDLPSFFTALQEQLGLKLESTKAPLEVTVIDSAEHPTED